MLHLLRSLHPGLRVIMVSHRTPDFPPLAGLDCFPGLAKAALVKAFLAGSKSRIADSEGHV